MTPELVTLRVQKMDEWMLRVGGASHSYCPLVPETQTWTTKTNTCCVLLLLEDLQAVTAHNDLLLRLFCYFLITTRNKQ